MAVFTVRSPMDSSGRFEISPEDLHHLTRVLRVRKGECFEILLPEGQRAEAILESEGRRLVGRLLRSLHTLPEKRLPLWIGIGLIRFSRLEWLVEKATELGVERLSPLLLSQGRFTKTDEISHNKISRLQKISQESLKQCERVVSPRIDPPQSLEPFLAEVSSNSRYKKLILEERSEAISLQESLEPGGSWVLLVGPEGGFSEQEKAKAKDAGFAAVSLGPNILRSETAALYAASALDFFLKGREKTL